MSGDYAQPYSLSLPENLSQAFFYPIASIWLTVVTGVVLGVSVPAAGRASAPALACSLQAPPFAHPPFSLHPSLCSLASLSLQVAVAVTVGVATVGVAAVAAAAAPVAVAMTRGSGCLSPSWA